MTSLSFVIPVYNSEKTISLVVDEIDKAVYSLEKTYDYEIILVNDFSRDNTLKVCINICKKKGYVRLLSFSKNFGQHHALMAGLREAKGDYIICLDDDLQTPPKEVGKLIEKLDMGYDVVFAQYKSKKHSTFRNIGSRINMVMANTLLNKPKDIDMTSFFIARRFIIDEVKKYDNPYPYLNGLIFRVTQNIGGVYVEHQGRQIGKSNYSLMKLVSLWLNGFTNFSVKPLRISSLIGFLFSITGFIVMLVLIIRKLLTQCVIEGWTSTMVLIIFFGGIQLISIGLVGEYIGRIFLCINRTPQYVIKESYKFNKEDK